MFGGSRAENKDDVMTKLLNSKKEVPITEAKSISQIISDAKKLNRVVIISTISEAKSALTQIEAFENAATDLNADIFVVNKQALTLKKFLHVKIINDSDGAIQKEIGVFLDATTIAIKPDGKNKIISLPATITEELAKKHIAEISQFIHIPQDRTGFTCP